MRRWTIRPSLSAQKIACFPNCPEHSIGLSKLIPILPFRHTNPSFRNCKNKRGIQTQHYWLVTARHLCRLAKNNHVIAVLLNIAVKLLHVITPYIYYEKMHRLLIWLKNIQVSNFTLILNGRCIKTKKFRVTNICSEKSFIINHRATTHSQITYEECSATTEHFDPVTLWWTCMCCLHPARPSHNSERVFVISQLFQAVHFVIWTLCVASFQSYSLTSGWYFWKPNYLYWSLP